MDPQKEENKEKLVTALHKEGELASLRTYQGDVASFIQSKDKSVADLAIKNREVNEKKQEKEEKEQKEEPVAQNKTENKTVEKKGEKSTNFLIYILGIFLIIGSITVLAYLVFSHLKNAPVEVALSQSILRAQNSVPTNSADFYKTVVEVKQGADYKNGITALEISDTPIKFAEEVKLSMPPALLRNLGSEFMAGVYGEGDKSNFFLILEVKDYGIAYRDMLAWEAAMANDFMPIINPTVSTSTDYSAYEFKDLIVKNKDTRAFSSKFGKIALIYTFLNQNTILITESESSLSALVNSFATGNTIR